MLNLTFKLAGPLKSGKNQVQITRKGHRYPLPQFVEWRTEALRQLKEQLPKIVTTDQDVSIVVDYVPPDRRRADMPGLLDALCHLLERGGVLKDDRQVKQCSWKTFDPDKQRCGCIVTILG